ncbi:hypothetical protein EYF80_015431 [Liparis tanakae]|uniref:Uncharacterized protein n=1 Tax=Liparis tanakae TaxID=230148 RepID=A0A4Z2I8R5_9TELE|nr:hypothetical protein EYF80_015431 [Liparis tanakae]
MPRLNEARCGCQCELTSRKSHIWLESQNFTTLKWSVTTQLILLLCEIPVKKLRFTPTAQAGSSQSHCAEAAATSQAMAEIVQDWSQRRRLGLRGRDEAPHVLSQRLSGSHCLYL